MMIIFLLALVQINNAQILEVFSKDDDKCLAMNGKVNYRGACHALLEKGPCPQNEWLVLKPSPDAFVSLQAECSPCPCCKETTKRIFWKLDGTCHQSNDPGVCKPGNRLVYDFDGTGICECKTGFVKIRGDRTENCYPLYRNSNVCKQGQFLAPGEQGYGRCVINPCRTDGQVPWTNNQCFALNTRGPCSDLDQIFRVDWDGQLQCISNSFSGFSNAPVRCREPCIILNKPTNQGSKRPNLNPKIEAFLKRQRLQVPTTTPEPFGPSSENWSWQD